MNIGVLALQGAVAEHIRMIEMAGAKGVVVKKKEQLADTDGIIIPGGESTTIGKLMRDYGFIEALGDYSRRANRYSAHARVSSCSRPKSSGKSGCIWA